MNFRTHRDRTWSILGNHWPSRSGGPPSESAGYRASAGETLAYFHERIREVHGDDTPVLAMGDFNDEPFDESLVRHALSARQRNYVVNSRIARLWNLMWSVTMQGDGTFYYENRPCILDQFLVNRNMAKENSPLRALPDSIEIARFPGMAATGDYPRPIPLGQLASMPS